MMFSIDASPGKVSPARAILRGVFAGVLGVLAIAVWATNLETIFAGQAPGGPFGVAAKLILCDAIPLATLCALYRGIGRNHSTEHMIRGVIASVFSFFAFLLLRRSGEQSFEEW